LCFVLEQNLQQLKKTLMASSSYFIGPIGIFCPEHRDAALIEGK
jgi:hypothetical protein